MAKDVLALSKPKRTTKMRTPELKLPNLNTYFLVDAASLAVTSGPFYSREQARENKRTGVGEGIQKIARLSFQEFVR